MFIPLFSMRACLKTIAKRITKADAIRKVWNQRRKQANKKLSQQNVELKKLHDELSKVGPFPIIPALTLICPGFNPNLFLDV